MARRASTLRTATRGAVILGAAWAMAILAGCGWTARDEFLRARRVTLTATPGDGSMGAFAPQEFTDVNSALATVPEEP